MSQMRFLALLTFFFILLGPPASAQEHFLEPADTFNRKRFWISTATATGVYAGVSAGLWAAWYRDYPVGGFRFFDDSGEWLDMDKLGHFASTYKEAAYLHHALRWTGMDRRKAMWGSVGGALLIQSTVEVMDGFSEGWGFSWYDMAYNVGGAGFFVAQEVLWEEQRITMKVSNSFPRYPNRFITGNKGATTNLRDRAEELYGSALFTRFVKDYNGQTLWFSGNPKSFFPQSKFPRWLNIAVGYGAENMYGGFSNTWSEEGQVFSLFRDEFPRYRQVFLSLDIDLERIPTKNRTLKFILGALNFIKIPAPTLEFTRRQGVKFHSVYW